MAEVDNPRKLLFHMYALCFWNHFINHQIQLAWKRKIPSSSSSLSSRKCWNSSPESWSTISASKTLLLEVPKEKWNKKNKKEKIKNKKIEKKRRNNVGRISYYIEKWRKICNIDDNSDNLATNSFENSKAVLLIEQTFKITQKNCWMDSW